MNKSYGFFFSSRRRHTRYGRDWSSDVCSADLVHANVGAAAGCPTVMVPLGYTARGVRPQGLGFMGRAYSEPLLLAFAYAYEQAARVRVPPTDVNAKLVDRKSTRLNSSHANISYAVFCLKKKKIPESCA